MREFHSQTITDEAQVGAARRAVQRYASAESGVGTGTRVTVVRWL